MLLEVTMPPVTVKPITIPTKLRRGINLREGDLMEVSAAGDSVLLRPMGVVDRNAVADRIVARFAATAISSEDAGRSEDEIMADTIADIAASRQHRRKREE